jgi:flagellin-like protein
MNKRALSPVVATVLLISLVLILAVIIFLWARAFLPEQLDKNGPIQDRCAEVNFVAEYSGSDVVILNQGNIPIHGVKIGIKKGLSLEFIEGDFTAAPSVKAGETGTFSISGADPTGGQLVVVPILLGRASSGELKAFVCDTDYGQTIDVS